MITSRGCDRSVLLNSTASNQAEREAYVNFGLRGVAEIDEIKAALEYACPGVVSSADILIKAARDATVKVRSHFSHNVKLLYTANRPLSAMTLL